MHARQAPQHTFWVVEAGAPHPGLPPTPRRFYFGRELGRGDRSPLRALDLRNRRYLGASSEYIYLQHRLRCAWAALACAEHRARIAAQGRRPWTTRWRSSCAIRRAHALRTALPSLCVVRFCHCGSSSLLTRRARGTSQALTRRGHLVYDPFTGTGSILLAAAFFGAMTMGADIDMRVLRDGKFEAAAKDGSGGGARVTTWSNFDDAALARPLALLRADLAAPPFRRNLPPWAHALICDPPYGVRAGGRKSGGRRLDETGAPKPIPEHLRATHIPSTAFYPLAECVADLLDAAAAALLPRGRLVYFFPASLAEDFPDALPSHPCLELVANSQQLLSTKFGRRLITMRKVRDWYPGARAEARAAAAAVAAAAEAAAAASVAARAARGLHPHAGGAWSHGLGAPADAALPFIPSFRSKRT
jgi:tRNA G10  N-methylase Trm11